MLQELTCFCFIAHYTIGSRGRPRLEVTREQLRLLLQHGFKSKAIARMLGCSTSYVYHKLRALGIRMRDQYTQIDDSELEHRVRRLHQQYAKSGYEVCILKGSQYSHSFCRTIYTITFVIEI